MSRPFDSKVVLITGGSTGIGAAAARQLAQAGAQVLVTGRHEATLRASAAQHPNIAPLVADIADPASAARTIEQIKSRYGRLDILVNNAAVLEVAPLSDAAPDHVRRTFDINVSGLIETTRHALPLLVEWTTWPLPLGLALVGLYVSSLNSSTIRSFVMSLGVVVFGSLAIGDTAEARHGFAESLRIREELGYLVGTAPALVSLADAESEPEASRLREEARRLFRLLGGVPTWLARQLVAPPAATA